MTREHPVARWQTQYSDPGIPAVPVTGDKVCWKLASQWCFLQHAVVRDWNPTLTLHSKESASKTVLLVRRQTEFNDSRVEGEPSCPSTSQLTLGPALTSPVWGIWRDGGVCITLHITFTSSQVSLGASWESLSSLLQKACTLESGRESIIYLIFPLPTQYT